MESLKLPDKLFEDCSDDLERAARIGRFLILQEMGYFGVKSNVTLALGNYEGTFQGAVGRKFSNTYGDMSGFSRGDLEVAAELLGVFDAVYDIEALRAERAVDDGA